MRQLSARDTLQACLLHAIRAVEVRCMLSAVVIGISNNIFNNEQIRQFHIIQENDELQNFKF